MINKFEKGIDLLTKKIQWLADNDKIKGKMIEEYNYILRLLQEGFNEMEVSQADTELQLAEANYKYNDLHQNTQKLAYLSSMYKINPEIIFNIDITTFEYMINNKCRVPRVIDDLLEIDMLLKAKKLLNDEIIQHKQTETNEKTKILMDCNIACLEIYELRIEKQLMDRT